MVAEGFARRLVVEIFPLYSVGVAIILLRMTSRIHILGIRNLQLDDYLTVVVLGLYTATVACMMYTVNHGGVNIFTEEEFAQFTEADVRERTKGCKISLLTEQSFQNSLWLLKVCTLCIFWRFTMQLKEHKWVKIVAAFIFISWTGTTIPFFTTCRPFSNLWAVKLGLSEECTFLRTYCISRSFWNIASDLLLLSIWVPVLYKVHLPRAKKIMVGFVFGIGFSCAAIALIAIIFQMWGPDSDNDNYMLWYFRELSVAVYVANIPLLVPFIRVVLPKQCSTTACLSTFKSKSVTNSYHRSEGGEPVKLKDLPKATVRKLSIPMNVKRDNSFHKQSSEILKTTDIRLSSAEAVNIGAPLKDPYEIV